MTFYLSISDFSKHDSLAEGSEDCGGPNDKVNRPSTGKMGRKGE
jgi:hypothetical protein